jgi:hypothetical protein
VCDSFLRKNFLKIFLVELVPGPAVRRTPDIDNRIDSGTMKDADEPGDRLVAITDRETFEFLRIMKRLNFKFLLTLHWIVMK